MAAYSDGLIYDNPASDLEVLPQQLLGPYADKPQQEQQQAIGNQSPVVYAESPRTIFGIRRITFFLLVIILLLVIAGAVGGGVGGSLAVQNARKSTSTASPSTATVTVTTTAANPKPTLSCNANNNTMYTAANGASFTVICGIDHPNSDLQNYPNITTLNDCIEHCATFNSQKPSVPCVAVAFAPFQSNCWIKSFVGQKSVNGDVWFAQM